MKKSTILIIAIVFCVSVFVVGVFGLKSVPYTELVYIDQIVPTSVTLSNGTEAEIKVSELGYYYIVVPYEKNMKIMINYNVVPNNATNRELNVTLENINKNSDGSITNSGAILLKDKGLVKVTYKALDSASAPTMVFYIYTE